MLGESLSRTGAARRADELVLACATPRSGISPLRSGWPQLDPAAAGKVERGDAALALVKAIERPTAENTDVIITAMTVLLGAEGIKAHGADVARIAANGRRASTVLLVEKRGKNLTMLATTLERPVSGATIH